MSEPSLIDCVPFSPDGFAQLVATFSGAPKPTRQIKRIGSYLALPEIGAKAIVAERHYIDRHFMEEYTAYYSSCLNPPPNFCARLHFFSDELKLDEVLRLFSEDDDAVSIKNFQKAYIGFVVIRPLQDVPVGRTVLKTLPEISADGTRRFLGSTVKRDVHIGSIPLEVIGLPFQQQDNRVGACATTALWSSLARETFSNGFRVPTPAQVTDAAIKYSLSNGRAYPAGGLTNAQMCEAVRNFALSPELISIGAHDIVRKLHLLRYNMRSLFAPVLSLKRVTVDASNLLCNDFILSIDNPEGHAVTVAGYRPKNPELNSELEFDTLFIHDDNIGPYSEARIFQDSYRLEGCTKAVDGLFISITNNEDEKNAKAVQEFYLITHMLTALYPKIRLSMNELHAIGEALIGFVAKGLEPAFGVEYTFDVSVKRSGRFLQQLRSLKYGSLPADAITKVCTQGVFSRYVGIVEMYCNDKRIAIFLFDTTDRVLLSVKNPLKDAMNSLIAGIIIHPKFKTEIPKLFSPTIEKSFNWIKNRPPFFAA